MLPGPAPSRAGPRFSRRARGDGEVEAARGFTQGAGVYSFAGGIHPVVCRSPRRPIDVLRRPRSEPAAPAPSREHRFLLACARAVLTGERQADPGLIEGLDAGRLGEL